MCNKVGGWVKNRQKADNFRASEITSMKCFTQFDNK